MARPAPFHFPFSPPDPPDAAALARAARYLLLAANEVETGRLLTIGFTAGDSPLPDLPAALQAAAHLCAAVAEAGAGLAASSVAGSRGRRRLDTAFD